MRRWWPLAVAVLVAGLVAAVSTRAITTSGDTPGAVSGAVAGSVTTGHEDGATVDDVGVGADPDADGAARGGAHTGLLLVWGPASDDEFAETVERLDGVVAVAQVHTDTLGLVASRDPSGVEIDTPPDGYHIPVAVMGFDPADWPVTATTEGSGGDEFEHLVAGTVVMSQTGARLRGFAAGGQVDIAALDGTILEDLDVVAVVPDGSTRGAEFVLHRDDAVRAGIDARTSLMVWTDRDGVAATIDALVEDPALLRVVDGRSSDRVPIVLSLPAVKERFGEFAFRPRTGRDIDIEQSFVADHIVEADVPLLGTVRCHRDIVDDLARALDEVARQGHNDWVSPSSYGGCWHPRRISSDGARLSRHAWGIAIDINVDLSMPGLGPKPPDEVIEIFGRHGFRWGGDFLTPDNHHFEWLGVDAEQRPSRDTTSG